MLLYVIMLITIFNFFSEYLRKDNKVTDVHIHKEVNMKVDLPSVTKKLQNTNSIADAKDVLEWIRKFMCEGASYEEALKMCTHYDEDIITEFDKKYPIFEKDVVMLLKGKDKNEQILLLSQMIILF